MLEVLRGRDDPGGAVGVEDAHDHLAHLLQEAVLDLLLHVAAVRGSCGGGGGHGSSCDSCSWGWCRQLDSGDAAVTAALQSSHHTARGRTEHILHLKN